MSGTLAPIGKGTLIALAAFVALASGCASGTTGSPNWVRATTANLNGKVVTDTAGDVEYWVEFGPTTAYGSDTPHQTETFDANAPTTVTVVMSGLARATRYHYRLCARDSQQQDGPLCGEDRTLTTQSVDCGETVTTDVRLTADMLCFNEAGLVIGADGVDVNLAGHYLSGGATSLPNGPRGIDNGGGFDDLSVRNGELTEWGEAIYLENASRNRVLDVDVSTALRAVTLRGGDHNEIRRSKLAGGSGLLATDSHDLVVAASDVGSRGAGILVVDGDLSRIVRNRVERSSGAPEPVVSGIEITGGRGGRIADNVVTGPWSFGGIFVDGDSHVAVENEVSGGVLPTSDPPLSGGDGIFVFRAIGTVVLRGNVTHDNDGDGIELWSGGVRLEDNTANDNGDFGIDAAPDTIDGGGNTATGNGNPLQCRNVFCAP